MKVELIAHTESPDDLCSSIAGVCTGVKNPRLNTIIKRGHLSVVEHAVFTFHISGVSRILTHQLVRHRIASYTQQSQRYTTTACEYVTPPTLAGNVLYDDIMREIWALYEALDVDKEDARYILPGGACTEITVTMNARELLHFFKLRCCKRSQWEIRDMAELMMAECKKVAPVIFADAGPDCENCREVVKC